MLALDGGQEGKGREPLVQAGRGREAVPREEPDQQLRGGEQVPDVTRRPIGDVEELLVPRRQEQP